MKKRPIKLLIVSICKNEAATMAELIKRMPRSLPGVDDIEICIIDDGSTDATATIARQAGVTVYSDGAGKGLAYRFREVVDIALSKRADLLVNIDGDLQFRPEDIPTLIAPIVEGSADFVAADRFYDPKLNHSRRPANMPAGKYYGNRLGAWVVSHLSGKRFNDVTCGFRAYGYEAIVSLNLNSTHTYTQESFQILAAKRLRIRTIPVQVTYYPGRKSRVVTSLVKYIATSSLNILRAYRDFAPLRFFFGLGFVPFVIGLAGIAFSGIHWLRTGDISPYKFLGVGGLYLISLGIFFWSLGLVTDMLLRIMHTQEKVYEDVKRLRYPRD